MAGLKGLLILSISTVFIIASRFVNIKSQQTKIMKKGTKQYVFQTNLTFEIFQAWLGLQIFFGLLELVDQFIILLRGILLR